MAAQKKADDSAVLEVIDGWPSELAEMGRRVHEIVTETDPDLRPRLWYGMPGYARKGPVLFFFRVDEGRFTLGLTEKVRLEVADDATDQLVPSAWLLAGLDEPTEERIAEIVRLTAD